MTMKLFANIPEDKGKEKAPELSGVCFIAGGQDGKPAFLMVRIPVADVEFLAENRDEETDKLRSYSLRVRALPEKGAKIAVPVRTAEDKTGGKSVSGYLLANTLGFNLTLHQAK
jgi:hypothetical protein